MFYTERNNVCVRDLGNNKQRKPFESFVTWLRRRMKIFILPDEERGVRERIKLNDNKLQEKLVGAIIFIFLEWIFYRT